MTPGAGASRTASARSGGSHQFKAGLQASASSTTSSTPATGKPSPANFKFDRDTSNPNDSGYAYANALLGNFSSYTEGTRRADYSPVTRILEWYVQDSWRATSRLTLDLGVRFTAGLPQVPSSHGVASTFAPSSTIRQAPKALSARQGRARQSRRIDPTCPAARRSRGLHRAAGAGLRRSQQRLAGTFTPGYPRGLIDYQGILRPRASAFAWNVTGDHRRRCAAGSA